MSLRRAYAERVFRLLSEERSAPKAADQIVAMIEEASVRAAGRGAGVAVEGVVDKGRADERCRAARQAEADKWRRREGGRE